MPLLVEWPDGRYEAVLFVVEEESDPRRFSIHRLAHYCLDVAELLETTRVVPVVIFLRGTAAPRELLLGGDRHQYPRFHYLACELASLSAESYLHSDNLVARLTLPSMAYPAARKPDVYGQAMQGLLTLEPNLEHKAGHLDAGYRQNGISDCGLVVDRLFALGYWPPSPDSGAKSESDVSSSAQ